MSWPQLQTFRLHEGPEGILDEVFDEKTKKGFASNKKIEKEIDFNTDQKAGSHINNCARFDFRWFALWSHREAFHSLQAHRRSLYVCQ